MRNEGVLGEFVGLEDKYEYHKKKADPSLLTNMHGRIVHLHNSDMNIIFRQNVKNIHQMGVMKLLNRLIISSLYYLFSLFKQGPTKDAK